MVLGPIARVRGPNAARLRVAGPLVALLALVVALAAAALSVDVVRTGYGIKGDEATYVSMAMSAAYDGDLGPRETTSSDSAECTSPGPRASS